MTHHNMLMHQMMTLTPATQQRLTSVILLPNSVVFKQRLPQVWGGLLRGETAATFVLLLLVFLSTGHKRATVATKSDEAIFPQIHTKISSKNSKTLRTLQSRVTSVSVTPMSLSPPLHLSCRGCAWQRCSEGGSAPC